jgi:hypothetical protein
LKKILQLIFIVIGLTSCEAQEVDGIWMSKGVIIDFDKRTIGTIHTDSNVPLNIDFKKSKLFMKGDTLNVDFKVYGKDSIKIDFGRNMMHVFRPLNLNHKLSFNKSQISDFLIKNDFEKINGTIDIKFSDKFFFRDVMFEKPNKKNALINKSWNDEGYWYVKEIEQNLFLTFTLDQTTDQNIYQIISLDKCKIELVQLQEAEFGNAKISELKTCL